MSDTLLSALINGGFGLGVVVLGVLLNRKTNTLKRSVASVRAQVENDHPTNMREENDERHIETTDKLGEIHKDVGRALREIERLRTSVVKLWEKSDKHTDQIHDLEMTQPRKEHH